MATLVPFLANETTAARLLDLKLGELRSLVDAGHLPKPREIAPGVWRWVVDDLQRMASREASDSMGGVPW